MWPMGLLFLKTSPVKQCLHENDFSGVFDAFKVVFLYYICNEAQQSLRARLGSLKSGTSVVVPYCYLFLLSVFILWFTILV